MTIVTRHLEFCTLSARPGNECQHCLAEAAEDQMEEKTGSVPLCNKCGCNMYIEESIAEGRCNTCRDSYAPTVELRETSIRDRARELMDAIRRNHENVVGGYPVMRSSVDLIEDAFRTVEREALERAAKAVEGCDRDAKRYQIADAIRALSGDTSHD